MARYAYIHHVISKLLALIAPAYSMRYTASQKNPRATVAVLDVRSKAPK